MGKISGAADGGTILTTDEFKVVRSGGNVRVKVKDMATQVSSAVSITGGTIAGLTSLAAGDTDITGTLDVSGDVNILTSAKYLNTHKDFRSYYNAASPHQAGNVGQVFYGISDGGGLSGMHVVNTHDGTYSSQSIELKTAEGGVASAATAITIAKNRAVTLSSTLDVSGALSKGSGSFKISHPLPELTDTHHLVHSFTESPQADLLYSGSAALVDGKAQINIDTFHGMTEGTFEVLCRNVRTFSSNETGFHHVRGSVEGNILNLECEDSDCDDTVSWLVIGERKDQHMFDTGWTNENGEVIVEPLKPEPVPEPEPVQRTVQVPIMAGDKQATKLETVNVPERIELIDGVATLIPTTTEEKLVPQFDTVGVFDTDGNPVYA